MAEKQSLVLSPLGNRLGLEKAVIHDIPENSGIRLETTPDFKYCNDKKTIHGGYLQAVMDEVMRILAEKTLEHKRAVTLNTSFIFYRFALPDLLLVFEARRSLEDQKHIYFSGQVYQNGLTLAGSWSTWLKRNIKSR